MTLTHTYHNIYVPQMQQFKGCMYALSFYCYNGGLVDIHSYSLCAGRCWFLLHFIGMQLRTCDTAHI